MESYSLGLCNCIYHDHWLIKIIGVLFSWFLALASAIANSTFEFNETLMIFLNQ